VLIVDRNAKFHSNLIQAGLFTAENVGRREDPREEDISLSFTAFTESTIFRVFSIQSALAI
jgi:hypothetical protein